MEMIIGICVLIIILGFFRERKYLKIIQELTDKLMSRSYNDYLVGKELKKDDKAEVETSKRTDKREFLIEKAKESGKKLKQVEKEFNEKVEEITV